MAHKKLAQLWAEVRDFFGTYKAIKNARTEKFLPSRPKPLSGRKLEREALREYGIRRKPGETDDQLRARIIEKVENEYIGTGVIPLDACQQFVQDVAQRMAAAVQVPADMLTGRQERENPFSGENLDKYAKERIGLTRKPGETDKDLLRRCMAVEVERGYGPAPLTIIIEGERENG